MKSHLIGLIRKYSFNKSMLQRLAEMQTSITLSILIQIGIVTLTYCRIVVLMYNRKSSKQQTNRLSNQQIIKDIDQQLFNH